MVRILHTYGVALLCSRADLRTNQGNRLSLGTILLATKKSSVISDLTSDVFAPRLSFLDAEVGPETGDWRSRPLHASVQHFGGVGLV